LKVISGKVGLIIAMSLILVALFVGGCTSERGFDGNLSSIVRPYHFSIVEWEFKNLFGKGKQSGSASSVEDEPAQVLQYFSLVKRINSLESEIKAINNSDGTGNLASFEIEFNMLEAQRLALEGDVRRIITKQIKEVLAEQNIFNPVDKYVGRRVCFPPVNFRLEQPPYLLVISPRDRIESVREITLKQNLSVAEMEYIEANVDPLGVSSLVVELGGFGGTYPTFVVNDASLQFTLDTATEEWLHQYLAFRPLGFLYVLDRVGIAKNYDIATMNETVAGIVSKEIGSMVYEKYYSQNEVGGNEPGEPESGFDFNLEMRETRRAVDAYLAEGEIEQAEMFMEERRQFLISNGYYIRKLNQAYFAFHGTYADRPASISPIGQELKQLRSQSASLKDFLDTVAVMTSHQDLLELIN